MTSKSKQEALDFFAQRLIHYRDLTIKQSFQTIEGKMKSPIRQRLYRQLSNFNEKQKKALYDLIIDTADAALSECLKLFEQEKEMALNLMIEDEPININDISDKISSDYWDFIDEFSTQRRL